MQIKLCKIEQKTPKHLFKNCIISELLVWNIVKRQFSLTSLNNVSHQRSILQMLEKTEAKDWGKRKVDFDAIIIYFSAGTGKKDRSKLFTWLKMTYNNRVLSSTPPCDHFCARLQRADCWHIFSLLPIHWKRETPYIQIQMNRNSTHHKASCSCMHPAESNAGYVNSNNGAALIRQAGRPSRHNEKDQPPHEAQIQGPEIWKYF